LIKIEIDKIDKNRLSIYLRERFHGLEIVINFVTHFLPVSPKIVIPAMTKKSMRIKLNICAPIWFSQHYIKQQATHLENKFINLVS